LPTLNAANAYGAVANLTAAPREMEAKLLVKAARKLQQVKDTWTGDNTALGEALNYNRRLWTVFASAVCDPQSPLPQDLRNNVANLSVFIFNRTVEAQSEPAPEKLAALIHINRELAAGLRGIESAND
jgi:flagellar protein FlaF